MESPRMNHSELLGCLPPFCCPFHYTWTLIWGCHRISEQDNEWGSFPFPRSLLPYKQLNPPPNATIILGPTWTWALPGLSKINKKSENWLKHFFCKIARFGEERVSFLLCKTLTMKAHCAGYYMFQFAILHPAHPATPQGTKLYGFRHKVPCSVSYSWVWSMGNTSWSEGENRNIIWW